MRFFPDIYNLIIQLVMFTCLLTGVINYRKSWQREYKWLIVLMGLTFMVEFGLMISYYTIRKGQWVYNLFQPVECLLFLLIYYRAFIRPVSYPLNRYVHIFYFFFELLSALFAFTKGLPPTTTGIKKILSGRIDHRLPITELQ